MYARKRTILARLNGAQKALLSGPNQFLVQLEQDLIKEYSNIRLQEEEYWALKSRINWAAYGDHNTSFFHVFTLVRRHRNRIRSIKNSQGEWVTEEKEVKNIILSGYKDLFETNLLFSTCRSDIENFSCYFLSEGDMSSLYAPVTEKEIKNGLWALKPFKAPGVDGLHARVFQHFWVDVRALVCQEVCSIFEAKVVSEYLNETLISLIPKCQSLESLNNYRHISLCNSIYKVVIKIILD